MKKVIALLFVLLTFGIYAGKGSSNSGSAGNGSNSGNSGTQSGNESKLQSNNENQYEKEENNQISKNTMNHYENLMKIMEKYKYSIKNKAEYDEFCHKYEMGLLKIDEQTMKMLKFEFQRYSEENKNK
ncbi:MAG: hypothetical protein JXM74_01515 [Fusobacteriaceae bacterium]|nr:hypothetical protein [Fusobacteriaceae bacterium]